MEVTVIMLMAVTDDGNGSDCDDVNGSMMEIVIMMVTMKVMMLMAVTDDGNGSDL